MGQLH